MKTQNKRKEELKSGGIEPISERQLKREYSELLDNDYGKVTIAGRQYATSDALVQVNPTAFNVGFTDWLSSECDFRLIEIDGDYYERNIVYGFDLSKEIKTKANN